jgi:hypothetical protein
MHTRNKLVSILYFLTIFNRRLLNNRRDRHTLLFVTLATALVILNVLEVVFRHLTTLLLRTVQISQVAVVGGRVKDRRHLRFGTCLDDAKRRPLLGLASTIKDHFEQIRVISIATHMQTLQDAVAIQIAELFQLVASTIVRVLPAIIPRKAMGDFLLDLVTTGMKSNFHLTLGVNRRGRATTSGVGTWRAQETRRQEKGGLGHLHITVVVVVVVVATPLTVLWFHEQIIIHFIRLESFR